MKLIQWAYRFADNSVSGFIGTGFDQTAAEGKSLAKIKEECDLRGEAYDAKRLISSKYKSLKYLTAEERKKARQDFSEQRGKGILATKGDLLGYKQR